MAVRPTIGGGQGEEGRSYTTLQRRHFCDSFLRGRLKATEWNRWGGGRSLARKTKCVARHSGARGSTLCDVTQGRDPLAIPLTGAWFSPEALNVLLSGDLLISSPWDG